VPVTSRPITKSDFHFGPQLRSEAARYLSVVNAAVGYKDIDVLKAGLSFNVVGGEIG